MANFEQTIKWLSEKKKVRRPHWEKGSYWKFGENQKICWKDGKTAGVHSEQIGAKDWEIFDDEKKEKSEKPEEKREKIRLEDYMITDPVNCCGILPIIKRDGGEFDEIDTDLGFFKKVREPKIILQLTDSFDNKDSYLIEGTRYSKEYIKGIKEMASVWFSDKPEIFMRFDKEKKEFLKDNPMMLIFDNKICFLLAPRIEE
tara:strand:- start:3057 stop:3659 length:603 start_codon:yes stop_codon:yes gene_type:complete